MTIAGAAARCLTSVPTIPKMALRSYGTRTRDPVTEASGIGGKTIESTQLGQLAVSLTHCLTSVVTPTPAGGADPVRLATCLVPGIVEAVTDTKETMKLSKTMAGLVSILALAFSGYAQDFRTNGLVAYFPFNGNAADESGNGLSGVVFGAVPATDRFGHTNSCYQFNGSSAHIKTFADALPSRSKTISLWF